MGLKIKTIEIGLVALSLMIIMLWIYTQGCVRGYFGGLLSFA